jgi:hypothetical protein
MQSYISYFQKEKKLKEKVKNNKIISLQIHLIESWRANNITKQI